MIASSKNNRKRRDEAGGGPAKTFSFQFPSFWDLFRIPEYGGAVTALLNQAESKIEEYVRFSDWIEKKVEKEEAPDAGAYVRQQGGGTSPYDVSNHAVLVWLFKFVFAMDEFWLRRALFFEFKVNLHRFINRFASGSSKTNELKIGQLDKRVEKVAPGKGGPGKWVSGAKERVFNLVCFLMLHEYYFVQEVGRPRRLLEDLTPKEWKAIIEDYLTEGTVPVKHLYKEAAAGLKIETLLDRFDRITHRIESTLNTGTLPRAPNRQTRRSRSPRASTRSTSPIWRSTRPSQSRFRERSGR